MAEERESGLSGRLAQSSQKRMLRQDGEFNVLRVGQGFWQSINPYHKMLNLSWPQFFGMIFVIYVALNLVFAGLYLGCGPGAISGVEGSGSRRFLQLYFFSVQTIATIGYGTMTPTSTAAHFLVSVEALTGLMGFALATGILFARFSRPTAAIVFSKVALISPFQGSTALMFRVMNSRSNQLMEVAAQVTYSRLETEPDGRRVRKFKLLPLERKEVMFLATQWVIVHPIDVQSPLFGKDATAILADDPEIIILITATDEASSQVVYRRFSYADNEIVHGAKFRDLYGRGANDVLTMDISRLDEYERVTLPDSPAA
ncbi:MAG: ion channel [Acidobacteria bacterium]|nr:ion channel [Acidobacteriota bacterium]